MGKENPSSVKHIHPFLRHTARTEDSHIERIYACGCGQKIKITATAAEEYY